MILLEILIWNFIIPLHHSSGFGPSLAKMECKLNKFNITPFSGSCFGNWLYRIKLVLEENNLLETLKSTYDDYSKLSEEQKKSNIKAKNILVQCIADSHLEIIKECKTAKEIVQKLTSTYQRRGTASQLLLRKKLLTLKHAEEE